MTEKCGNDKLRKIQEQLEAYIKQEKITTERNKLEEKAIFGRFVTRLHSERKEAETEAACTRAKDSRGWRSEEVIQEDVLAREMAKHKQDSLKEMKLRDYLRNSEELKELEKKLRTAYIQKDLASQLAEKKAEVLKMKQEEQNERNKNKRENQQLEEAERLETEDNFLRRNKYKKDLQDQLIDNQKVREFEYKKQLEGKVLLEDSLRTILEEDQKEKDLKLLKRQKYKEDADAVLRAKQSWIQLEKEFQEEGDLNIKEFVEDKARRERDLQEINRQREIQKMRRRAACIEKLQATEGERAERDRVGQILMTEETRLQEEERSRKEQEKRLRQYLELKEAAQQMEVRRAEKEREKREDMEFTRKIIQENEEALKMEEEERMRRRKENIEHGKMLRQLIENQNIEKLKRIEVNYMDQQRQQEVQKKTQERISEERVKLVKEHAPKLVGYLPKGTLRPAELAHLDPDIQEFYRPTGALQPSTHP